MTTGNCQTNWRMNCCSKFVSFTFCLEAAAKSVKTNADSIGKGAGNEWRWQIVAAAPGEGNGHWIRAVIFTFSPVCLDSCKLGSVTCGLRGIVNPNTVGRAEGVGWWRIYGKSKCIFNHQDMLIVRKGQAALLSLQGRGSVEHGFSFFQLFPNSERFFLPETCCRIKSGS